MDIRPGWLSPLLAYDTFSNIPRHSQSIFTTYMLMHYEAELMHLSLTMAIIAFKNSCTLQWWAWADVAGVAGMFSIHVLMIAEPRCKFY